MKMKVTSFHLLSVVLLQIIVLDVFLIGLLIRSINNKHNGATTVVAGSAVKSGTSGSTALLKAALPEEALLSLSELASIKSSVSMANTVNSRSGEALAATSRENTQDTAKLPQKTTANATPKPAENTTAKATAKASVKPATNETSKVAPGGEKTAPDTEAKVAPGTEDKIAAIDFTQGILRQAVFRDIIKALGFQKVVGAYKLPGADDSRGFIATAYDLSYQSCGKYPSNPQYGITYSGKRAKKGRTIAVDPDVIPLGSSVYIEFPSMYSHMNGWYVAEDTGSKVKGNIIDVFFGESALKEAMDFGRQKINVKIVYSGETYIRE